MEKRRIYFIVGIILALTAVFLVHSYVQSERQRLIELAKRRGIVEVVIAKRDIPARTKISSNMLDLRRIPSDRLEPEALSSIDSVVGKVAKRDIIKGQQITASLLFIPGSEKTLSLRTPEGKRAITIPVDKISSIEGMITPGDHVDIIGNFQIPVQGEKGKTFTQNMVVPMFQNVLVLAVGSKTEALTFSKESKERTPTTITIALSPEEASLLTYAMEIGKIRLLLRSPLDEKVAVTQEPITMDKLWEKLLGIKQVVSSPPPPPETVEVYKGTEKTSVIIEKR